MNTFSLLMLKNLRDPDAVAVDPQIAPFLSTK